MYPTAEINTAILGKVLIDNSFNPKVFEFNEVLNMPYESIYLWTHEKNKLSKFISIARVECHQLNYWKNFGIVLKYALAITSGFESIIDVSYNWISGFDPKKKKEEFRYPDFEEWVHDEYKFEYDISEIYNEGTVLNLHYLYKNIRLIEELYSNDNFFSAVQNLVSAMEIHSYCQICALTPPELRKHPNHDFEKYYEVYALPRLEIAIVQATKAVEGLLGQPGKKKERRLTRWKEVIDIVPNEIFLNTNMTFFKFHEYLVNDLRNKIAHNLRTKPFKIIRQETIQAQSFAWIIISNYYRKLKESKPKIMGISLNKNLEKRIRPNIGTNATKEK